VYRKGDIRLKLPKHVIYDIIVVEEKT